MTYDRLTTVRCVICGRPVRIEECQTNDHREPVHEPCYAEQLKEEIERRNRKIVTCWICGKTLALQGYQSPDPARCMHANCRMAIALSETRTPFIPRKTS